MADHSIQPGQVIGDRFEIIEAMGSGSFGTTYKAIDQQTQGYVVIKGLPDVFAKRPALREHFLSAARQAQEVDHPSLVKIIAVVDEPPAYVESECEGLSLRQVLQSREQAGAPFALNEVEPILEDFARGLTYLHHSGRIHGALKPENIFLTPSGVQIDDFAKSSMVPKEAFIKIQLSNGTAEHYVAPELVTNPSAESRAVDIYSIGAVIHETLSLRAPSFPLQPLDVAGTDASELVNRMLAKALDELPNKRIGSINALVLDLARALGDEDKIKVLQNVVLEEAKAEASAQIAAAERTNEDEPEQSIAPASTPPTEATPDATDEAAKPSADVASTLFDDDDGETEDHDPVDAAPRKPISLDFDAPASPHADLDSSANIEVRKPSGNKNAIIGGAVAAVLLVVGGGGYMFVKQQQQEAAAVAAKAVEAQKKEQAQALGGIAEAAVSAAQKSQKEAIENQVHELAKATFDEANKKLTDANGALSRGNYESAAKWAQEAQQGFVAATSEAMAAKEKELAKAEAAAEAAESAPAKKAASGDGGASAQAAPPSKPVPPCPDGMIQIPAGTLIFGSDPDDLARDYNEEALVKKSVKSYCIDRYEYPNKKGSKPKVSISQSAAANMCKDAGKRLCTELEWERSCKGATNTTYPYGNSFDAGKCITEDAKGDDRALSPAGSAAQCKSSFGVYDLSGNALEWTSSKLEKVHVAKGGSHDRPDYAARCAYRYPAPGKTKAKEIGFRCCADVR